MKKRNFVKTSLLSGSIAGSMTQATMASANKETQQSADQEFYELRIYTLKNGRQQKLVEGYFQNALIPAMNKLGSKAIGVFTEYLPQGHTKLFALIPYNTMDDFVKAPEKMAADAAYKQGASAYLQAQ